MTADTDTPRRFIWPPEEAWAVTWQAPEMDDLYWTCPNRVIICLRQCGRKSTVSDRRNPADLHTLTLTHRGPPPAYCAALVTRRADRYRIQSASFRTSVKETVTWFDPSVWRSTLRRLWRYQGLLPSVCEILLQAASSRSNGLG